MSENPHESAHAAGQAGGRKSGRLLGWLYTLFAFLFIVGILVALLLPAVRTARTPSYRMQCTHNLKQIAIALLNYQDVFHSLPPAYTVDADGRPLHSWRTLILPFMEELPLYKKIDLSKPWDDPANEEAYETVLDVYQCHKADCPPTHTMYLAVVARGGCFRPTEPRRLSEITDDPELTLMVIEVDARHSVHWMAPTDASEQMILDLGKSAELPHSGVVLAACVSGNVRSVSSSSKPATLRALISIDGRDDPVAEDANQRTERDSATRGEKLEFRNPKQIRNPNSK